MDIGHDRDRPDRHAHGRHAPARSAGVAATLSGLTNADGSSVQVSGGASLTLPGLASYAGGLGYTDTLQATGAGSVLSFPALASITGETPTTNPSPRSRPWRAETSNCLP